jgi:cytochrome b561
VWWLHISIGLLVLLLLLVRSAARNMSAMPAPSTALTPLTRTASHAVHIALYILLLAVPVVGIGLAFLRCNDVSFFGLFSIPSPIAVDRTTAGEVQEVHEWLANALIVIAVLHACAALWHHFVKKDDILARMLPGRA